MKFVHYTWPAATTAEVPRSFYSPEALKSTFVTSKAKLHFIMPQDGDITLLQRYTVHTFISSFVSSFSVLSYHIIFAHS